MCFRLPSLLAAGLLATLAGGAACAPATDRPVRGALPGIDYPTPTAAVPPTLAAGSDLRFRVLPNPSPGLAASPFPSPSASPVAGAPPIVRSIQPPQGASVPLGAPLSVSAVLVGRGADLASASLVVDAVEQPAQIDRTDPRTWTVRTTLPAPAAGVHTARVSVRDSANAAGGFTWQFVVGTPTPTEEPAPEEPAPEETPTPAGPPAVPTPAAATPAPSTAAPPRPTESAPAPAPAAPAPTAVAPPALPTAAPKPAPPPPQPAPAPPAGATQAPPAPTPGAKPKP